MLAATSGPSAIYYGMDAIPLEQGTLKSEDLPIPISDSVRAATWDGLTIKPLQPIHVQVACIVIAEFGVPGSCVRASSIAPESKVINWVKARDDHDRWERTASQAEVELLRIATERLHTARTQGHKSPKLMFSVKFFDEIIAPRDARPPFTSKSTMTMNDIVLTKPIDGGVIRRLYPVVALRNNVAARVRMICDIENDLKLLCRDQGAVELAATGLVDNETMIHDFRLATYQFASTLQIAPKDKNGIDVTGRQLKFAISWQLPEP